MARTIDKHWVWTAALLGAMATGGIVGAQEGKSPQGGSQGQMQQGQSAQGQGQMQQQQTPTAMAGSMVTATATVEKINPDKRELTLKASDTGKTFTIDVPQNVTRLENVKKGDTVRASFYQSVAVSLLPPGQSMTESSQSGIERNPGRLPNGAAIQRITTTAKITKIDKDNQELTLENPTGQVNTVQIQDPSLRDQMGKLKVGDRVKATYTEALATSVTPKKAM